ncbi:putative ammonium transporter 1 [Eurytemora carolleeae]|uniref:putative ammonium transporter 1 n=1 Tax=Eurytemora carolleeae TaxID=1294199 RepID=UPI000C75A929|nr:putative ammonium transporter 1 [Eurytemora carolleeae]XP_023339892.1 putative ammonium transporter 1 [Eurytemora carolleeae]|eukprot:XP_023339891.1 putative ammonium transporter 1 [Eurytemora affinis]
MSSVLPGVISSTPTTTIFPTTSNKSNPFSSKESNGIGALPFKKIESKDDVIKPDLSPVLKHLPDQPVKVNLQPFNLSASIINGESTRQFFRPSNASWKRWQRPLPYQTKSKEYPVLTVEELSKQLLSLEKSTDHFFLIVFGVIIWFMQCGFAFLEAGAVRSKNTVNILIKNLLDAFIGGISYWAFGWGLAYGSGGNGFCGASEFLNYHLDYNKYPKWFFQFGFAATSSTIVAGAIAERCQIGAYFIYSTVITGFVYPIVSHWAWDYGDYNGNGQGWLNEAGFLDFGGSGVVHLVGSSCSLVACAFIGRRRGRFNKQGQVLEMLGHSVPLSALGGFILILGFIGLSAKNASISQEGDGATVALAIVNTVLGASSGGISVLLIYRFVFHHHWSFLVTLNGSLAGMVSICGGANVYEPWAALVIGTMAGIIFLAVRQLMFKLQLDDPLDSVAVHGTGGVLGLLAVPFFMYATLDEGKRGIFFDGHLAYPWTVLGYNALGCFCIIVWSCFWSVIIFGLTSYFGLLRITVDMELRGVDYLKHGESAYPAEAWVEFQYKPKAGVGENYTPDHMAYLNTTLGFDGISLDKNISSSNDPHILLPTTGILMNNIARGALDMIDRHDGGRGKENLGYLHS